MKTTEKVGKARVLGIDFVVAKRFACFACLFVARAAVSNVDVPFGTSVDDRRGAFSVCSCLSSSRVLTSSSFTSNSNFVPVANLLQHLDVC